MKRPFLTSFILAAVGAAAITIYATKKVKSKRMLARVADEGYETAGDILYPGKEVKGKLHYGPVLPG